MAYKAGRRVDGMVGRLVRAIRWPVARDPGGPGEEQGSRNDGPGRRNAKAGLRRPWSHRISRVQSFAAYTCLPPSQVCSTLVLQILLAGSLKMSWSTRMKSAHLPGSSVPRVFSACCAYAASRVNARSAWVGV